MDNLLQNLIEATLFFVLLLGLNYFVYYEILFYYGISWKITLFSSSIIALLFSLSQLIERYKPNIVSKELYLISSIFLGFTFYLLFFVIALLIIEFFVVLPEPLISNIILALNGVLTLYSILNAKIIKEKVVKLSFKQLKHPIKIIHISDVHIGSIYGENFLKKLVKQINNVGADLLVITGDLADGSRLITENSFKPFKKLDMPSYFVSGNHDGYSDLYKVFNALNNANINILNDNLELIRDDVELIGLNFSMQKNKFNEVLTKVSPNIDKLSILLNHEPKDWDISRENNVNLQLCGHTHGGQLYPMNFIVKIMFPYFKGLFQKENDYLYVSEGTGTWGPPLRLASSSEIIIFELKPKK